MNATKPRPYADHEARKAAVHELAARIFVAFFAEWQGTDSACAMRSIEAAEAFTAACESAATPRES